MFKGYLTYRAIGRFSRRHVDVFFLFLIFSKKIGSEAGSKISPNLHEATDLFSRRKKEKYFKMSSVEILPSMQSVNIPGRVSPFCTKVTIFMAPTSPRSASRKLEGHIAFVSSVRSPRLAYGQERLEIGS